MPTKEAGKETLDKKALLTALRSFQRGDFSVRLPGDWDGADMTIRVGDGDTGIRRRRIAPDLFRLCVTPGKIEQLAGRAERGRSGGITN